MLQRCYGRSPLVKTLDRSVETLDCECKSIGLCIHLNSFKLNQSRERNKIITTKTVNKLTSLQQVASMAVRPEHVLQGYDVSRFIGEVREDLLCIVCQDVPKNPRCCQNKDHLFCHAHILRHLRENSHTCPVCRDSLSPETLRRPTGFLKNYLDDLKIKCDHHDRGCTDDVRLEDLQRHVDKCGFTPVMCENEGCEMVVNKRDKDNHERNLCQFRVSKCHDCRDIKTNQDEIKVRPDFTAFLGKHCICFVDLL